MGVWGRTGLLLTVIGLLLQLRKDLLLNVLWQFVQHRQIHALNSRVLQRERKNTQTSHRVECGGGVSMCAGDKNGGWVQHKVKMIAGATSGMDRHP